MDEQQLPQRPIGWWLKEADARLDAAFDRALAGRGVGRRAWQVLATLARSAATRQDLVAGLAPFDDAAAVGRVLDDLRERGWVAEPADGALRLTPDGAREQQVLAALVAEVRQTVATALPEGDHATLVRLLARLVEALPPTSG